MQSEGKKARIVQSFPDNRVSVDWDDAPKMKRENENWLLNIPKVLLYSIYAVSD